MSQMQEDDVMAKEKYDPPFSHNFFRLMILVFIICIGLELIGNVLGVFQLAGGGSFPLWVKTAWTFVNVVLTVFVSVQIGAYIVLSQDNINISGLLCLVFSAIVVGSVFCVAGGAFGIHSIGLFFLLIVLLIVNFVFMAEINVSDRKDREKKSSAPIETKPEIKDEPLCSVCKKPCQYSVCLECDRKYQREIQRVRSQNWRAKKAGEPATLTIAEWLETLEAFHHHCAYCQTGPYELMEHYIPIGQGKKDGGTTSKNCVPSCFKCNVQKSNRHPGK
jgi:uncharacterized membrane protein